MAWTAETVGIAVATFLLAGLVKGVIGLGVPTVSLALLAATLGLKTAMALLIFPSLVTNVWQAVVGAHFLTVLRRLWVLFLFSVVTVWLGVQVLAGGRATVLAALLGVVLAIYAVASLARPEIRVAPEHETWLSPIVGALNGFLTGMTGSFVVPAVPYLQALGMPRDMLVQAMGILFTLATAALALALGSERLLSSDLALMSAACVIPALIGMTVGQRIRGMVSEAAFRKVFFGALLVMGLYIIITAVAGKDI